MSSLQRLVAPALVLLSSGPALADAPLPSDASAPIELGHGVDSDFGNPRGACVDGVNRWLTDAHGSLGASFDATLDGYLDTTNGRLDGGVDLGFFAASATFDYYSRVARSELSTAYTLAFELSAGSLWLRDPALSELGKAAALLPAAERAARCGDAFISRLELGSRLLLSAVFQFASQSELERFVQAVHVKALFGLIRASRQSVEETRSFAETGYLRIEARQEGGDSAALRTLLGGGPTTCSLADLEPCLELWRSLGAYATHVPEQFSAPYRPGELFVLRTSSTSYADTDLDELASDAPAGDPEAALILRQLLRSRAALLATESRLEFLLAIAAPAARSLRSAELELTRAEITAYDRALALCRGRGTVPACSSARAAAEAAGTPLGPGDLSF